jgi:hypothetical protein
LECPNYKLDTYKLGRLQIAKIIAGGCKIMLLLLLLLLFGIAGDSVSGAPNSCSTQVFFQFSPRAIIYKQTQGSHSDSWLIFDLFESTKFQLLEAYYNSS